jgi:hypothetical protein
MQPRQSKSGKSNAIGDIVKSNNEVINKKESLMRNKTKTKTIRELNED